MENHAQTMAQTDQTEEINISHSKYGDIILI
jgi:hypothetical protein